MLDVKPIEMISKDNFESVLLFDRWKWLNGPNIKHRDGFIESLCKSHNVIDASSAQLYEGEYEVDFSSADRDWLRDYSRSEVSRMGYKHFSRLPDDERINLEEEFEILVSMEIILLRELINRYNPCAIITDGNHLGCCFSSEYVSRETGTPVIGVENSFTPSKIYIDAFGPVGNEMKEMRALWDEYRPYRVNPKTIDVINDGRAKGQVFRAFGPRASSKMFKGDGLEYLHRYDNMKNFDKYVLICGQMDNDSVMCRDIGDFKNIDDFFETILSASEKIDAGFVFRLHPWDFNDGKNTTFRNFEHLDGVSIEDGQVLGDNFVVLRGGQILTHSLFPCCSCAITLTSQIGIEAAINSLPVITMGNAFYDVGDFTIKSDKLDILSKIDFALNLSDSDIDYRTEKAKRFASFLYDEYMIEKGDAIGLENKIRRAKEGKI